MPRPSHEPPSAWLAPRGPALLIEPDPRYAIGLVRALSPLVRVRLASGLADSLTVAAQECPELVLVSDSLPEVDLVTLLRTWQRDPLLADVPMVVVLSQPDERAEVAALNAGAVACLPRQAGAALIRGRLQATLDLLRNSAYWRQSAESDALTGLVSRRQLEAALHREWRCAQRLQRPLTLLMVDVDHFRAYSDRHGLLAGDECLRAVAQVLVQGVRRATDLVGRFGATAFTVLLSETDGHGGLVVTDLLRKAVADRALPHGGPGAGARVSVSIGVSAWAPGGGDPGEQALLASAAAALRDAKRQGRDGAAWHTLASAAPMSPQSRRSTPLPSLFSGSSAQLSH